MSDQLLFDSDNNFVGKSWLDLVVPSDIDEEEVEAFWSDLHCDLRKRQINMAGYYVDQEGRVFVWPFAICPGATIHSSVSGFSFEVRSDLKLPEWVPDCYELLCCFSVDGSDRLYFVAYRDVNLDSYDWLLVTGQQVIVSSCDEGMSISDSPRYAIFHDHLSQHEQKPA